MAELHVQEKERSAWPWILTAVFVLALLFWFLSRRGDSSDVSSMSMSDSTLVGADSNTGLTGSAAGTLGGAAVTEFLRFVDNRSTRAAAAPHDNTADGLRQLAAALGEVAGEDNASGVALQPRLAEIRERADAMQQNAASSEHALQTREAFSVAAALIGQIRGAQGNTVGTSAAPGNAMPDSQGALQEAAMAIDPARPLLDQTNQVDAFFAQAAVALRSMTGASR